MASVDEEEARKSARECLRKFNLSDPSPIGLYGRSHKMSSRFLHPDFVGDGPDDRPLRPLVEELLD